MNLKIKKLPQKIIKNKKIKIKVRLFKRFKAKLNSII